MTLDSGDKNIPERVRDEIAKAKRLNKKGLIILTGDVGSLGVSVPEIDVTVLMHDFLSHDKTFQQIFRCLTEDFKNGKRTGIIIDFDVWRVLNTVYSYASGQCGKIFKNTNEKITWCISHLITIDSDLWECPELKITSSKESVIESLTTQWTKMMESGGHNLIALSKQFTDIGEDQQTLNNIIKYIKSSSSSNQEKKDKEFHDGISVRSEDNDSSSTENPEDKDVTKNINININEILTRLIPEAVLWTEGKQNMLEAFKSIGKNPVLRSAMNQYLSEFAK
jgi:hypothetical protein